MIYVCGDTHGAFDINKINPRENKMMRLLTSRDYLIICGDFGCVWDGNGNDRFWLNWIESLPWTTLFIDGNHDNFPLIDSYPEIEWHGGKVNQIRSNIFHLKRGEIYEIDGRTVLAFGGAASHDAEHRTEDINWWKAELPQEAELENARKNIARHGGKVDFIISHDVFRSHSMADRFWTDMNRYGSEYLDIKHVLEEIRQKTQFKVWFTGHYHDDFIYWDQGRPILSLFRIVVDVDQIPYDQFRQV